MDNDSDVSYGPPAATGMKEESDQEEAEVLSFEEAVKNTSEDLYSRSRNKIKSFAESFPKFQYTAEKKKLEKMFKETNTTLNVRKLHRPKSTDKLLESVNSVFWNTPNTAILDGMALVQDIVFWMVTAAQQSQVELLFSNVARAERFSDLFPTRALYHFMGMCVVASVLLI